MAGPGKKQQRKERHTKGEGSGSSSTHQGSISESKLSPVTQSPKSPPAVFDGSRDPGTASGAGGHTRSSSHASRSSDTRALSEPPQTNVQPPTGAINANVRNLGLPVAAWAMIQGYEQPVNLPKRPGFNSTGRPTDVKLNTFHVVKQPSKVVYQYDVHIGNGAEKRALIKKMWYCQTVQTRLGSQWIFDGNKLAWSLSNEKEPIRLKVDLDKEQGKPNPVGSNPIFHDIYIRQSGRVKFDSLNAYLDKKTDWNNGCLEATTFLDHLLREWPSTQYTVQKRSFFARGGTRTVLGGGIEAMKGVYVTIRPVHPGTPQPKAVLSINIDVSHTTFFQELQINFLVKEICRARDFPQLVQYLRGMPNSFHWPQMRKLRKLRVSTYYRGMNAPKEQVIERVLPETARQHKFEWEYSSGKKKAVTVYDYFKEKYDLTLQFPDLPVVKMVNSRINVVNPMEIMKVLPNQRFGLKLDDKQTSEMIKFAVTIPAQRWQSIQHGLQMLNWADDPNLLAYGLQVSLNPAKVKARVLNNPMVTFAPGSKNSPVNPKTSGRWDLIGKKFLGPNTNNPLKSWGVGVVAGRYTASLDQVRNFMRTFMEVYRNHGGLITNDRPPIVQQEQRQDLGEFCKTLYDDTGNSVQMRPQMLFFIVPDKESTTYMRIKKSCDCRFGLVSQVLQSSHVQKAQAQYCSNVAMKVNAKLGGWTAQATPTTPGLKAWFDRPTMIIGADVSHAGPGSEQASIAAVTVSADKSAIRYMANVETNGFRVEIITYDNIKKILEPMVDRWAKTLNNGNAPKRIIYFRDGVSEGQYSQVLNEELASMRKYFIEKFGPTAANIEFVVLIATKRHHVRFFPDRGDRNGNAEPGTLVETGVTDPFDFDFYLCAHSAIKGTARPVHYYVLLNEAGYKPEALQNMIYEFSYQYVRSTTPVSLCPPIYYAHLTSNRGISHIDMPAGEGPRDEKSKQKKTEGTPTPEVKPLIPMSPHGGIHHTMWFV